MTKVLVLLNSADAQSVPLELAVAMKKRGILDVTIAAYRSNYEMFPDADYDAEIIELGARGAFSISAIKALNDLIKSEHPDIIHLHLWPSGIWAILLGWMHGKVLIKTEHNNVRFQSAAKRIVNALLYPFLSLLICNSETTRASLGPIERFAVGRRTAVLYNGVDFSACDAAANAREDIRAALGLKDEFVVGSVGRFVEQKNYLKLIEAFAKTSNTLPNIRLLLVGDGPLRGDIEKVIEDCGVSDSVILAGAVGRDQVYRYLRAMDAFIAPSLWEGFCNAAVEAASTGLPMALSNIATLKEVLGPSARFFDPTDTSQIIAAIRDLEAMQLSEREMLGKRGAAFVRDRYEIQQVSQAYEKAFLETLSD